VILKRVLLALAVLLPVACLITANSLYARLLAALEAGHLPLWRSLGSPRYTGLEPGPALATVRALFKDTLPALPDPAGALARRTRLALMSLGASLGLGLLALAILPWVLRAP
jgi:hypothetical protein